MDFKKIIPGERAKLSSKKPRSRGGDDSLDNTVALCPNCHRKMHFLDLESDSKILLDKRKEEDLFSSIWKTVLQSK